MSPGSVARSAATSFSTPAATSSVLASGWLRMLRSTALTPCAVTMLKPGATPRTTRATSRRKIGAREGPSPTTIAAMSSAVATRPLTSVRYSW